MPVASVRRPARWTACLLKKNKNGPERQTPGEGTPRKRVLYRAFTVKLFENADRRSRSPAGLRECEARSNPQLIQFVALFTACGLLYKLFENAATDRRSRSPAGLRSMEQSIAYTVCDAPPAGHMVQSENKCALCISVLSAVPGNTLKVYHES